jgi:hypothetical protein
MTRRLLHGLKPGHRHIAGSAVESVIDQLQGQDSDPVEDPLDCFHGDNVNELRTSDNPKTVRLNAFYSKRASSDGLNEKLNATISPPL